MICEMSRRKMSKLHPELQKSIAVTNQTLKDFGLSDFHSGGIELEREFFETLSPPIENNPPIYQVEDQKIDGSSGKIPIRVYYPFAGKDLPALVWFHGGGWVIGNLETADFNCRKMANDFKCVVISIDYRLAPETPFPGALDDCYFATKWVVTNPDKFGIDVEKIAVGGDSAGGNLAACVSLRCRDNGLPVGFQLLVYPVIEANFDNPSYQENGTGYLLTRDAMIFYWDCYVPNENERKNPYVAPLHAKSLANLPPAFIISAEFDPLREEAETYGKALMAAGVDVEIKRYAGMIHGFFNMLTDEPVVEIDSASTDASNAFWKAFGRK
jgi:acetyl esterase